MKSKFIKPSVGCSKKNIYKYLTFRKRPKSEIDFGFSEKGYLRFYYKCKICGHLIAKHKKSFFENLYSDLYFKSTYKNPEFLSKTFNRIKALPRKKSDNKKRITRIKKFLSNRTSAKKIQILDVGSGIGIFPISIHNTKFKLTSIEPSKDCVKFITKKTNRKIKVICANFLKISPKDLKKYHLITFNKVLEHVEKPKFFLKKAINFLKKPGIIYIEVPNVDAINDKKEGKNREEFALGHHHVFSKKSLYNLFISCNMKVAKIKSIREPSGKYTLYGFGLLN
tara:strand:+ start:4044 stop:4886 length:843 start_codon:yes stop_codon:yes gene_type:complete